MRAYVIIKCKTLFLLSNNLESICLTNLIYPIYLGLSTKKSNFIGIGVNMVDLEFGNRLTNAMKQKNITNTQLTELAEISKNNIGNYKNGQIPNANILYKLSKLLGVSMEYLLTGKEASELSPDEQKLIEYYRKTDERGKRNILRQAEAEAAELESSNSKIG